MSALADIYIKKETLKTILDVLEKGGGNEGKGVSITVSINDESNQYGQNISAYVSQTKEQREAKKDKYYVANGKVFWSDGKITKGVKPEEQSNTPPVDNPDDGSGDLPF